MGLLVALLVIIILAIIGFLVWFFIFRKKNRKECTDDQGNVKPWCPDGTTCSYPGPCPGSETDCTDDRIPCFDGIQCVGYCNPFVIEDDGTLTQKCPEFFGGKCPVCDDELCNRVNKDGVCIGRCSVKGKTNVCSDDPGCQEKPGPSVLKDLLDELIALLGHPEQILEIGVYEFLLQPTTKKLLTASLEGIGKRLSSETPFKNNVKDVWKKGDSISKFKSNPSRYIVDNPSMILERDVRQEIANGTLSFEEKSNAIKDSIERSLQYIADSAAKRSLSIRMSESAGKYLLRNSAYLVGKLFSLSNVIMFGGIFVDLLDFGGWLSTYNTKAMNDMIIKNVDIQSKITLVNQLGSSLIIMGPNDLEQLKYEYMESSTSFAEDVVELGTEYIISALGSTSPTGFIAILSMILKVYLLNPDMTEDELEQNFSEIVSNLPDGVKKQVADDITSAVCEKNGGVMVDTLEGIDTYPNGWGKFCSFKTEDECRAANGWVIGFGPKYGVNMEWRSREFVENMPIYFKNTPGGKPINPKLSPEVSGVCMIVPQDVRKFCDEPQVIRFTRPFYSYNRYDDTTGVCHNTTEQCQLWGQKEKTIKINGKDYPNCEPDELADVLGGFFIGSTFVRESKSCVTTRDCPSDPSKWKEIDSADSSGTLTRDMMYNRTYPTDVSSRWNYSVHY